MEIKAMPMKLTELGKNELYDLLIKVRPEATAVSNLLEEAGQYTSAVDELRTTDVNEVVPISSGLMIIGLLFYVVPGLVYVAVKTSQRKKRKKEIEESIKSYDERIANLKSEAKKVAADVKYLSTLPKDYRNALAVNTMLKFLENDRASTWGELVHQFEEQKHWWALEKSSEEARQFAEYSAILSAQAASSANTAAGFAAIGAAASIANLFW